MTLIFKILVQNGVSGDPVLLKEDTIWDPAKGGLDKNKPIILINPANSKLVNDKTPARIKEYAEFFEKGLIRTGTPQQERQYLVTTYQNSEEGNRGAIIRYNTNPVAFTTHEAKEQARLIYGRLVTINGIEFSQESGKAVGIPLSGEEIIKNLSKIFNYNSSFGIVHAIAQINALVQFLQDIGVPLPVVTQAIGGMRRLDNANVARTCEGNIYPSTVVFEGLNDKRAEGYINCAGLNRDEVPAMHLYTNCSVVRKKQLVKFYQTLPTAVYDPKKTSSLTKGDFEKRIEEESNIYFILLKNFNTGNKSGCGNFVAGVVLGYYSELYFSDPQRHYGYHYSGQATVANEVKFRNSGLIYELMTDMVTREKAEDTLSKVNSELFMALCSVYPDDTTKSITRDDLWLMKYGWSGKVFTGEIQSTNFGSKII